MFKFSMTMFSYFWEFMRYMFSFMWLLQLMTIMAKMFECMFSMMINSISKAFKAIDKACSKSNK